MMRSSLDGSKMASKRRCSHATVEDPQVNQMFLVKSRVAGGTPNADQIAVVVAKTVMTEIEYRQLQRVRDLHGPKDTIENLLRELIIQKEYSEEDINSLLTPSIPMYYVSYTKKDKRLDEWIEKERFVRVASPYEDEDATWRKRTRSRRRYTDEVNHAPVDISTLPLYEQELEKMYDEKTKVRNLESVTLGSTCLHAWYFAPYPKDLVRQMHLFICEQCIAYFPDMLTYSQHLKICEGPPGLKIYEEDDIVVFEAMGYDLTFYCQCLCLLAKLFLHHKTLYFDVRHFVFYVLYKKDATGLHITGFFSKERNTNTVNNLACILILPSHQRCGYGSFLVQLSYVLSACEGYVGGPERPFSDLGRASYKNYWWFLILGAFEMSESDMVPLKLIAKQTGLRMIDIEDTLEGTTLLTSLRKGKYMTCSALEQALLSKTYLQKPPKRILNPSKLMWSPMNVRGPPEPSHFDLLPHLGTLIKYPNGEGYYSAAYDKRQLYE